MRVVIGEDSALFREGLARLLEDAGHDVVAKSADAPSLIAAVEAHLPDLAIIDIRMPPDNVDDGARAARRLREAYPDLAIVLLSQHIETHHSVELVSSGRFGYLLKDRVSTSTISWTRFGESRTAARPWTPRSSLAFSAHYARPTGCRR